MRLRRALIWGATLGAIGFAGGFFGPMVLDPSSGNGPLLGIFITGPGGALVGFLAGMLWKMPPPPAAGG